MSLHSFYISLDILISIFWTWFLFDWLLFLNLFSNLFSFLILLMLPTQRTGFWGEAIIFEAILSNFPSKLYAALEPVYIWKILFLCLSRSWHLTLRFSSCKAFSPHVSYPINFPCLGLLILIFLYSLILICCFHSASLFLPLPSAFHIVPNVVWLYFSSICPFYLLFSQVCFVHFARLDWWFMNHQS